MRIKKIIEYGAYVLVFLLPWQTVWILYEGKIGRAGSAFEGAWQYGILRMYAIECLIVLLFLFVVVSCVLWISKNGLVPLWRTWRSSRFFLLDIVLVLFCAWVGMSIFWSDERIVSLFAWGRVCEGAFLFFLFRTARFNFTTLSAAWIGAATIQSFFGIEQFAVQQIHASTLLGIAEHLPGNLGDSVVQGVDTRWLRAYGAFQHPNIFGAYLAISFAWCLAAQKFFQKKRQWLVIMISAVSIAIALFFTFSRGAWIGLILGLCMMGVLYIFSHFSRRLPRERGVISPVVVTLCISMLVVVFLSSFFVDEIKGRIGLESSRLEQQSISERVTSIARAEPLVKNNWLTGGGIGNFTSGLFQYEKRHNKDMPWYTYQPLHNVPLMIFAELGVFGLALVCIVLILFFRALYISRPSIFAPVFVAIFVTVSAVDHFLWTIPVGIFIISGMAGIMLSSIFRESARE